MAASVTIQSIPVRRVRTGAIVVAAVIVGLLAEHAGRSWFQPAYVPILDRGIGWLMVGCGLAVASARPGQPAGNRLVLAGFLTALRQAGMDGCWWAAGEWWKDYPRSLQPTDDFRTPAGQLATLRIALADK